VARTATAAAKLLRDFLCDIVFPPLISFIGTLSLIKNEQNGVKVYAGASRSVKEILGAVSRVEVSERSLPG
jgi:predicted Fe-Mo cluster-binding NifX family protein